MPELIVMASSVPRCRYNLPGDIRPTAAAFEKCIKLAIIRLKEVTV